MSIHRLTLGLLALLIATLGLAGCGGPAAAPADAHAVATPGGAQTIEVKASEFAFAFSQTAFQLNTPYRFVVENIGAIPHEWVIEGLGQSSDNALHGNAAAIGGAELVAGASISRELAFDKAGTFEVTCRLPGHYEAGMKLTITVQ